MVDEVLGCDKTGLEQYCFDRGFSYYSGSNLVATTDELDGDDAFEILSDVVCLYNAKAKACYDKGHRVGVESMTGVVPK